MRLSDLAPSDARFRSSDEALPDLRHACASNPDLATLHDLGRSEEGRPLYGVALGNGPRLVTLMAGAHADEPVGPETLRALVLGALAERDWLADGGGFADLFDRFTFRIVPHVNPDAEARNRPWIDAWPDVQAFLRHRRREPPGRDVEFGFPVMRPENRAASRFLFDYAPIALHVSLHGMAFSEGPMLLIERHCVDRTEALRDGFRDAVHAAGLHLHDHDRGGDKGFDYIEPGFSTTPECETMKEHFRERGDLGTARGFFLSSMEMARIAGYDAERQAHPLCLVTELPLFVLARAYEHEPGVPTAYLAFRDELPELTLRAREGDSLADDLAPFQIEPLALETAIRLQLRCIELGLEWVARRSAP